MNQRLCAYDDIEEDGSIAIEATVNGEPAQLMLIRKDGLVYAYKNICPHIGAPLDFTPGQFLNAERNFIMCSTHGALFQIEDGLGVSGPCQGQSLESVPCQISEDSVWID
ncbi:Rieske 2Fe-2S domain-containing protein [Magnetovibrio sp. PR-2]|uniref:Rieske (2Fe-2S) protein n=1 Tax=Magnetovibrio sp. PR-2 TaxID=3120356 RepID=UPI002FCE1E61